MKLVSSTDYIRCARTIAEFNSCCDTFLAAKTVKHTWLKPIATSCEATSSGKTKTHGTKDLQSCLERFSMFYPLGI